ncbi:alpha-ketoglutarate permease [Lactobacillus delbrueckii subsp. jakobsenii ZN7a-9 = DSM 26046]|nr:alpha-ketoglutarate permease [Lactobacillus delbrueckii subsp. jakobsenii ZN7a-9 = DSM 26046]EOD03067.1 Alpha-ketoglutarate permease, putative [Lactobacillus delbrueckii subsp. jakobsenii ZN7a-9 = DSM 26046]
MRSIGHESLFFYYVLFAAFISLLVYVFALKGCDCHRSALDDEA